MEASAPSRNRALPGEKAERIVDAMRASVARRGVAGSTFDHVAREAGVSRGLLHYYFGTKERLLAEVVRRDCEVRMAALDEHLAPARTADDVLRRLLAELQEVVDREPDLLTLLVELFTLGRRHPDVATAFAELQRRMREQLATVLRAKHDEGVLRLAADAEAIADVMLALADGMAMRMVAEPDRDWGPAIAAGLQTLRPLIAAPR
jgi:AcrR family transcriptional regulator